MTEIIKINGEEKLDEEIVEEEIGSNQILLNYASTGGSAHKLSHAAGHINNQDAIETIYYNGQPIGGVICDGCGTLPHCEIGARFGAISISELIEEQLEQNDGKSIDWDSISIQALKLIDENANMYHRKQLEKKFTLRDYFSFTILIGVVIDNQFVVACCGDGMYMVDDSLFVIKNPILEPRLENEKRLTNAPPYLIHNLIPSRFGQEHKDLLSIHEVFRKPVSEIKKTMLIGSDGFIPLARTQTDYIHHPALMPDSFRLKQWIDTEIFLQQNTHLPDDVSVVLMRTVAMQNVLLEERSEIAMIKKELSDANKKLQVKISRIENLEKELRETKRELAIYKPKPKVFSKTYTYIPGKGEYYEKFIKPNLPIEEIEPIVEDAIIIPEKEEVIVDVVETIMENDDNISSGIVLKKKKNTYTKKEKKGFIERIIEKL